MNKENLIELAKKVAELRIKSGISKSHKVAIGIKMTETPTGVAYSEAEIDYQSVTCDLDTAETELKSAVLAVYTDTGEKKPIDKVEVKIYKELEYDPFKAEGWCRTFAPAMLTLNKEAFEKVAESFPEAQ